LRIAGLRGACCGYAGEGADSETRYTTPEHPVITMAAAMPMIANTGFFIFFCSFLFCSVQMSLMERLHVEQTAAD
jgi:hypothetical protein